MENLKFSGFYPEYAHNSDFSIEKNSKIAKFENVLFDITILFVFSNFFQSARTRSTHPQPAPAARTRM